MALRDIGLFQTTMAFLALYLVGFVVTQLYLHPLSRFPGPRIAAVTRWYEFYQDVICDGGYVKYYPMLHKKLGWSSIPEESQMPCSLTFHPAGPIVRIAPNHLHINDPEFYNE